MSRKLSPSLSSLQRKASQKISYLKKQGLNPIFVEAYTPFRSTQTVKDMSARERKAYQGRLSRFVNTEYTVLSSGEPVKKSVLENIEKYRKQYNERAAKLSAQIDARTKGTGIRSRWGSVEEYTSREYGNVMLNGEPVGGTFVTGRVKPLEVTEAPKTLASALNREKTFKKMASKSRDDERRSSIRESAVRMLLMNGDVATARRVRNMRNDQFDVLTINTNFFDLVKEMYEPETYSDYGSMREMSTGELYQYRMEMGFNQYGDQGINDLISMVKTEIK